MSVCVGGGGGGVRACSSVCLCVSVWLPEGASVNSSVSDAVFENPFIASRQDRNSKLTSFKQKFVPGEGGGGGGGGGGGKREIIPEKYYRKLKSYLQQRF